MIAAGNYVAKAKSLAYGKSPEKGTPCAIVQLVLQDGPDMGATVEWIGWLTEKTEAKTAESMALMGYDGIRDESIVRNNVQVVIEHEHYMNVAGEQKTRVRVAWINDPSAAGRFETLAPGEVTGIKQRLQAAMIAAKAKAAAGKTKGADDLNF